MRLLIVSHTPHYQAASGPVGWGATVRELDHLATLFTEVVHLAPLYGGPAPASSRPYRAANLRLRFLPPTGGPRLVDKLDAVLRAGGFFAAFAAEARQADVIHVRAPAGVALLAFAARSVLGPGRPWWVKYAGNWRPHGLAARAEARSYRWQRAWLRRQRSKLAVTVNGRWPGDGRHIEHFLNPCLSSGELRKARSAAAGKRLDGPPRLLFVGRLESAKGAGRALEVLSGLGAGELELAGDGPERPALEQRAHQLGVRANFRGWLAREELDACYRRAHFLLLPSLASEGWPKVVSEAMAWGVVPVTSDVSSLPQILGELELGGFAAADDIDGLARTVERLANPQVFEAHSRRAAAKAELFTYERYLDAVRELFRHQFSLDLGPGPAP